MTTMVLVVFCSTFLLFFTQIITGQKTLLGELSDRPELSRYRAWITKAELAANFGGQLRYTLFAPNNTAFEQMTPEKRARFERKDRDSIYNYIYSLSIYSTELQTSSMVDESEQRSQGRNQERLFIAVKPASQGIAGINEYYVNGAKIINADIRCTNGILHIIDFIPEETSNQFVFGYLNKPDLPDLRMTQFYQNLLRYLPETKYTTISDFRSSPKLTVFVPSDEAIAKIPTNKLSELRGNDVLLNQVIRRHYIKDRVIHTSWIVHRQQFQTEQRDEKIIFRKIKTDNFPERVFIMSEGVNAEVTYGNITVANGVIHVVDSLLGYTYYSAKEQIDSDVNLNSFSSILELGSADLQNILRDQEGNQRVTVFAPTNEAIQAVANLPGVNLQTDRTLADKVIRYHVLEIGNALVVMDVNRQYESREMRRTMYQGKNVVIYQRYNETFVEAGYVRAKVVRPDVGVTNGYVQYIDQVFGVPSKDIPTLICEDNWIYKSYLVLNSLTLGEYLRDRGLSAGSPGRTCTSTLAGRYLPTNNNRNTQQNQNNQFSQNSNQNQNQFVNYENVPREFTIFITNGSSLEYFEQTNLGRVIMQDSIRYRWVMRRHIIPGRTIHLDNLPQGDHIYTTDNGETIVVKKNGYGIRAYVEVIFGRKRAQVLHMDLGATNGVVHIIRDILAVDEDRIREVSSAQRLINFSSVLLMFLAIFIKLL